MAKKSQNPSVGLIITLVFFVLATLVAGTMALLAQDDIKKAEDKAANAEKTAKVIDAERRQERIRKDVLRIALGIDDPEDRKTLVEELDPLRTTITEEYNRIKSGFNEKGAVVTRKDLDAMRAEMDKKNLKGPDDKLAEVPMSTFNWPVLSMTGAEAQKIEAPEGTPAVGPLLTIPAMIAMYENRTQVAETARKNAETKATEADNLAKKTGEEKTSEKKMFDDRLRGLTDEKNKDRDKVAADFKAMQNKHMEDHKKAESLANEKAAVVNQQEIALNADEVTIKGLQNKIKRFEGESGKGSAAGVDYFRMEEKKGEILRREEGGFVVINIGSSKKLRPQVTFLVISAGVSWMTLLEKEDYLMKNAIHIDRQPFEDNPYVKAGIEVVEITGPDTARCKIVYENEPIRNPVQAHDQVFNLAWEPSEEIRIAFAGIIDLDGDGLDNNDEFLRMLERQGIIVDEYLRLKPLAFMKRDGKGMTLQTRFLVLAADPKRDPLSQGVKTREHEQEDRVAAQLADIRKRAKELGVQIIDANKFLAMIGYKLPRKPLPPQYGAGAYLESPPPAAKQEGN